MAQRNLIKQRVSYECRVCGYTFPTLKLAESGLSFIPKLRFKVGDKIVRKNNRGAGVGEVIRAEIYCVTRSGTTHEHKGIIEVQFSDGKWNLYVEQDEDQSKSTSS